MKELVHTHAFGLFFALVVGLCTVLPVILAPFALGENYHGIQYLPLNDEDIYRARINEILDGYYGVTSPFLFEYKNSPILWPPLNEWLYALPAFLFGLGAVIVASKFLLPAALFFLIYLLTRKMLGSEERLAEISALATGLVSTLGIVFVDYHYLFLLFRGEELGPVMWTRLVNPITGGVELFVFLVLLWAIWQQTWRYAFIPAGALLALMIGYYFAFGMGMAVLGTLFLIALYRKEFEIARQFVYVGLISVALDSWIWYNVLTSIGGEEGRELAMRSGMFFTHEPVLNKILLLATVFVTFCFWYVHRIKKESINIRSWLFMFALIAGSWLAFNQQILTGRQIWYHHFVQYTVPISMLSVIAASYFTFRDKLPRLLGAGMLCVIATSLSYGALSVGSYVRDIPRWYADEQRYGELAAWLDANAVKDCVVLDVANDVTLARHIPAYSHCNTYLTHVSYAGVPEERNEHNFFVRMGFAGVKEAEARSYLTENAEAVREDFFPDWNAMFGWDSEPWIDERIASLAEGYKEFTKTPLESQIRKYRVEYVVSMEPLSPALKRALPSLSFKERVGKYDLYVLK